MGILIKFCNEKGEKGKENEFSKIVPSQMAMDLIKGFKTLITMPPKHSDSKNDFNTLHFSRIYRSYHEGRKTSLKRVLPRKVNNYLKKKKIGRFEWTKEIAASKKAQPLSLRKKGELGYKRNNYLL